eukprot:GEMP01021035.1.p1 GENE.GEMP01021035.1~~GEMP01021035.1.p1  ORF type:complete len:615 (+),score=79.96 GEMP01021035.1:242-2086(+)
MDPNISTALRGDEEDSFHIELIAKCTGKREKRVCSSEEFPPPHPCEHRPPEHRTVKKAQYARNDYERNNYARRSQENNCERNGQDKNSEWSDRYVRTARRKRKWRGVPDDQREWTARPVQTQRCSHPVKAIAQSENGSHGVAPISRTITYSGEIAPIAQPEDSPIKSWARRRNRRQNNQWRQAKNPVASEKATYEVSSASNEAMCYVFGILVNILLEHNFHSLVDIVNLQRTCRLLHDGLHTPYFYTRILRDLYHVPFRIKPSVGPYNALRRWYTQNFEWIPLQDESTVWLSRAVDPNAIGCHDGPVYVFGGQSIRENRYSSTLFKITLRGHELIKEDVISRDMGPCGRAACGLAYVEFAGEHGTPISRKLYVFGGRGFGWYLDDVWCWENNTWEMVRISKSVPSPLKRWAHSMVSYPGGFLMYGGSAPGVLFDDLWSFRPEDGWSQIECTGALPPSRAGQASLLHQNYMYISGGNTAGPIVETYHDVWRIGLHFPSGTGPDTHPSPLGPWEQLQIQGPTLTARIGHSLVPLNHSRIILFGGRNLSYGIKEENQFVTNADVIDVETCTNTPVLLPPWLQRTGACALNHPEGVVFWGGLAPDRTSIAPAVLLRPI